MASLHELSGRRLICHCALEQICHADVLIDLWKQYFCRYDSGRLRKVVPVRFSGSSDPVGPRLPGLQGPRLPESARTAAWPSLPPTAVHKAVRAAGADLRSECPFSNGAPTVVSIAQATWGRIGPNAMRTENLLRRAVSKRGNRLTAPAVRSLSPLASRLTPTCRLGVLADHLLHLSLSCRLICNLQQAKSQNSGRVSVLGGLPSGAN